MDCYFQRTNLLANCSDLLWHNLPNIDLSFGFKAHIFLLAFNALVSFLVTAANFVVIYTILRTPSLQKPSNYLILGLAIADLGVGVLVQPSFFVMMVCMLAGKYTCLFSSGLAYGISGNSFVTASVWTLGALTADRFIAIKYHLRYREIVTVRRTSIVYGIICFCAIFSGVGWLLSNIVFIVFSTISTVIFLVTIYFLFKIQHQIRRLSKQTQAQHQHQNVNIPRIKKKVYVLYYISGALVVCYFPFVVRTCFGLYDFFDKKYVIERFLETLVYLNSLLNPMIYFWRIEELRSAARHLMRKNIEDSH